MILIPPYTPKTSQYAVISVPHTGTRALRDGWDCWAVHAYESKDRIRSFLNGKTVACPLREPKDVWRSWVRRVGIRGAEMPLELFDLAWKGLVEAHEEYDITYIPAGTQAEGFPSIDWDSRIGHLQGIEQDIPKDLGWIYDLPMVKPFYQEN